MNTQNMLDNLRILRDRFYDYAWKTKTDEHHKKNMGRYLDHLGLCEAIKETIALIDGDEELKQTNDLISDNERLRAELAAAQCEIKGLKIVIKGLHHAVGVGKIGKSQYERAKEDFHF